MGLIKALGLDGRILFAQLFNFSILIFVLWRFAYKPVLNILEERRLKIDQGLDDAEAAATRLRAAEEESKQILIQARQNASQLIEKAQQQADLRQREIVKTAEADIGLMMDKEREKIKLEKSTSLTQLKTEVSNLVLLGLKRFLSEEMGDKRDQELINRTLEKLV